MDLSFVLEAVVVLGAIVMGTRAGGVGVGLWGGLGTFVLVFIFGEAPGEPPAAALAIILAVVTTAAMMQAAGGIDWMVSVAARVIEKHPKQITLIAPLTAFMFSIGAGTSNIIYPLLPVIYDVSYKNGIRPSRPLTVTVVQSGMALAASPVSAAMAAMLTLTDIAPYDLGLTEILAITLPSCVIGIVVTSMVVNKMGKDLDEDPEVLARIAAGELVHWSALEQPAVAAVAVPVSSTVGSDTADTGLGGSGSVGSTAGGSGSTSGLDDVGRSTGQLPPSPTLSYTKEGRNSALAFLFGVVAIVIFGLFPDLRPSFPVEGGEDAAIDMTTTIVMVMFVIGVLILLIGRPDVKSVPD